MKKISKIWILVIVPLLALAIWYIGEKIVIKKIINERCSQFTIGDDWVGCVIDFALKEEDAKYCRSESIFSPYPGICMEHFAQKTPIKESCGTITKPRYKKECFRRF